MAIPEAQLETWSHQGAVAQSSSTYATIKHALEATDVEYAGKEFEVFLQGSYANDTNVFSESDVDLVIRIDSVFYKDMASLPPEQKAAFEAVHSDATYTYGDFKAQVTSALKASFGNAVKQGGKAITIEAGGARRKADVLVAAQFRRYHKFVTSADQRYDSGICFWTSAADLIANYPKQHSTNCTLKHQATNGWFKPMVRILKNLRSKLVANGVISQDIAPSYFLEGLLYNVPNDKFAGNYADTMVATINWIYGADRTKFVCANEQYYLLGDTAVTWPSANCDQFLNRLIQLWKTWG